MIEVNLLPGAPRRSKGGRKIGLPGISLPRLPALPALDRWIAFIVVAWVLAPAVGGWMFLGVRARKAELDLAIEAQVQDSIRYAGIIQTVQKLRARQDTIAQKVEIIQGIDAGRYIWPHVLDEVARAVPEYTWLTGISQVESGALPLFQISGRAGNTFALATYMKQLEDSPFVSGVRLTSSQLQQEGDKLVYGFMLEASYEEPPPELIQTVPLFASDEERPDIDGEGE